MVFVPGRQLEDRPVSKVTANIHYIIQHAYTTYNVLRKITPLIEGALCPGMGNMAVGFLHASKALHVVGRKQTQFLATFAQKLLVFQCPETEDSVTVNGYHIPSH